MSTFISDISGREFPIAEKISAKAVRQSILALIKEDNPAFTSENYLSISELNLYREKYVARYVSKEIGELSSLEQMVINSLADNSTLTDKLEDDEKTGLDAGQKVADKVASFGGSWTFILSFGAFLLLWILSNVLLLVNKGFDPYPFILLNLILSCLAAIQAPVIMMSQNRQEEKDRERAKNDYMINLKAELELRMLHEKIDHLIINQHQELLEIQKVQIEILNDIYDQMEKRSVKEQVD
jgi:uncharacterized membrane protein